MRQVLVHAVRLPKALAVVVLLLIESFFGSAVLGQDLDWATRAGGPNFYKGRGIASDTAGNSYVTGYVWNEATFGFGEENETTLAGFGIQDDIFLAKYNATGMLLWAKHAGSAASGEIGFGVGVDCGGNSYVTGVFSDTPTFGAGETNETTLQSPNGSQEIFVAKYDGSGALLWARQAGGLGPNTYGRAIAVDCVGNSYVTGTFNGSTVFGLGETNETTLTPVGVFVAKYDNAGLLVWAKKATGSGLLSDGIAIDADGNSYVAGFFYDPCFLPCPPTFGPGEANETVLSADGDDSDIFVAKYDNAGTLLWVKRAGGIAGDSATDIGVDSAGNSYVTGIFGTGSTFGDAGPYTATFGTGEANETTLTTAAWADMFLAKYDGSGELAWAKWVGGAGVEEATGVAVDKAGNSYVTGHFGFGSSPDAFPVTFGQGEVNETILTPSGTDVFVAKFDNTGAVVEAKKAGGTGIDNSWAITVDTFGNSYVTGSFRGSATFGAGETNETTLDAFGNYDNIFVAKYIDFSLVADAGPDQLLHVPGGATADVTLDGSGSINPSGSPLIYTWTGPFPEGGGVVMNEMPMVTLPPGVHTVTLTVDDGGGLMDSDTVEITVLETTMADAGPDQWLQVPAGGTADVTLDGSGSSDLDMDMLTFTWTGPFPEGGGTVMGVMPMVTLPEGAHNITLTVDDGNGGMDSDTVQIEVVQAGACPADLVIENVLLPGAQTLQATATATLGPNLIVNGTNIIVNAPAVTINGDTEIRGTFSIGTTPSCSE